MITSQQFLELEQRLAAKNLGAGGVKPREAVRLEVGTSHDVAGQPSGPSLSSCQSSRPSPRRIRQSTKPLLNELEKAWLAEIEHRYPNYPPIRSQAKRYEFARGAWYKPDFTCSLWPVPGRAAGETAWECKGPRAMRNQQARGFVVLKAAARQWPEVRFVLVWREAGVWREQEVLP